MTADRKILVFYLGVGNMHNGDISEYVDAVRTRFFTQEFVDRNDCEILLLPVRELNSRVECINPVYVTDKDLIKEHETLMQEFNESLNNFIVSNKK